jgi:hypothetical protein
MKPAILATFGLQAIFDIIRYILLQMFCKSGKGCFAIISMQSIAPGFYDVGVILLIVIAEHASKAIRNVEYRLQTKSSEYRWFHARGMSLRDKVGHSYRAAGSLTDITALKQAQQLAEMAQHIAEEANKSKSDFLAVYAFHIQFAGFDLGEIENIIDNAQQCFRRAVCFFDIVALLSVQVGSPVFDQRYRYRHDRGTTK